MHKPSTREALTALLQVAELGTGSLGVTEAQTEWAIAAGHAALRDLCESEDQEIVVTLSGGMVRTVTINGEYRVADVHDYDTDGQIPDNEKGTDINGDVYWQYSV